MDSQDLLLIYLVLAVLAILLLFGAVLFAIWKVTYGKSTQDDNAAPRDESDRD